jgi:hypothetical protein
VWEHNTVIRENIIQPGREKKIERRKKISMSSLLRRRVLYQPGSIRADVFLQSLALRILCVALLMCLFLVALWVWVPCDFCLGTDWVKLKLKAWSIRCGSRHTEADKSGGKGEGRSCHTALIAGRWGSSND